MEQRYTFLFFPLLFSLAASAQTPFEYADQRTQDVHYTGCAIVGDRYIACGTAGDDGGVETLGFLTCYDAIGAQVWTSNCPNVGLPQDVVASSDGGSITAGPLDGCDTGPWNLSVLAKFDSSGAVLWSHVFSLTEAAGLAQATNGAIAVWKMDSILITTATGDSLMEWPAGNGHIIEAIWETDSTLLIACASGVERRAINGTLLSSTALGYQPLSVAAFAGHTLALTLMGRLLAMDDTLAVTDTIMLGNLYQRGRLIADDTSLWAITNEGARRFDGSLNLISSVSLDPLAEFSGEFDHFDMKGGRIALSATEFFENRAAGLLRTIGTDGAFTPHALDIAATIDSVDSTWYTLSIGGDIITPYASATVRVTNVGQEVVHDLVLNYWHGPWICSAAGISERYDSLNIAPGQFALLHFQEIFLQQGPVSPSLLNQNFCLLALSPNSEWDRDMSDNPACDTAHFILGITDHNALASTILITNPFTDRIDLRFPAPSDQVLRITLFDASARQVAAIVVPSGSSSFSMNTSMAGEGFYLLRGESDAGSFTRKLVSISP